MPLAREGRPRSSGKSWQGAIGFILCLCVLGLGGCQDRGLSPEDVRERGFLRAGYTEEPPYAFRDSTGRVAGESPQALHLAAEALGIHDIRWIRLDFRDLIPELEQGRVDVIAAGMYRTPERAVRVRFTRPTACSGPALVVDAGGPIGPDPAAALDKTAHLAVVGGSVEQMALQRLGVSEDRILAAPDVRTALTAVLESKADALAITEPTARWLLGQLGGGGLEVMPYEPPSAVAHLLGGCSALAFRPEDGTLASSFDSALVSVLQSSDRDLMFDSLGFSHPSVSSAEKRESRR